ncbi:MAG TPA: Rha family transcriptional regulator [Lachnoclostridium phytofermentans]|uniref:Rha family transcriptional regulator n=1 Tax=Lachnoclostridium phytofermentans TaxID=66219 RepID=A0A3D2X7K0_9FIRM|nr:Rha family transcriptional regulator [Lachnoclostridium sp.]HCL03109.1 Rha family transcriptional regulator [Lachnoclostridium phytofermentans]
MNQLEQKTITSVEVAEMVGKDHNKLLRDIRGYVVQLGQSKIGHSEFFNVATYLNNQNKELPCFLVTKRGCEFIGNKLTGIKGTEFTAKYINRFHDMEDAINSTSLIGQLSPELQMFQHIFNGLAKQELEMKKISEDSKSVLEKVESIREVVALDTTSWREDTGALLRKIGTALGGGQAYSQVRSESYELLNKRMGVDLQTRLTNKRRRMADNGVCKSTRDKLSYVDVIAEDKKLIEGYTAIVKEMSIKYGA